MAKGYQSYWTSDKSSSWFQQEAHEIAPENCDAFIQFGSKVTCDLDEAVGLIKSAKEMWACHVDCLLLQHDFAKWCSTWAILVESCHLVCGLSHSRPLQWSFDFDHHYPSSESNPVVVVLYGQIGTPAFHRFHKELCILAKNSQVHYILRHFIKVCKLHIIIVQNDWPHISTKETSGQWDCQYKINSLKMFPVPLNG